MKIYQLTSENLSTPERSSTNWTKPYESCEAAMLAAEIDYIGGEEIKWTKGTNSWHSQDLTSVMYYINEVEVGTMDSVAPKMIEVSKVNSVKLIKELREYISAVSSKDYDKTDIKYHRQKIFEAAVMAFYGENIFNYINSRDRK